MFSQMKKIIPGINIYFEFNSY